MLIVSVCKLTCLLAVLIHMYATNNETEVWELLEIT